MVPSISGDHVIPGIPDAIARCASGRRVLFLSNNPTKTPDQYVSKLTKLGIPAMIEDVLTSALITWPNG
jgi:NagD protein